MDGKEEITLPDTLEEDIAELVYLNTSLSVERSQELAKQIMKVITSAKR